MPEYAVAAVLSAVAVVAYELGWARTGLLRRRSWWVALGICYAFMALVNGWLTKLSAPIVVYDPEQHTTWRVPWDIPVEDYVFGFSLMVLVGIRWIQVGRRRGDPREPVDPADPAEVLGSRPAAEVDR